MSQATINYYMMDIRQTSVVVSLGTTQQMLHTITFLPDGTPLQSQITPQGHIELQYPMSLLEATMQMIRYERQLMIEFFPPNQNSAHIIAPKHPLGEQEGV